MASPTPSAASKDLARKAVGQAAASRCKAFKAGAAKAKPAVARMPGASFEGAPGQLGLALGKAWEAAWAGGPSLEALAQAGRSFPEGLALDVGPGGRPFEILLACGDLRGGAQAWALMPSHRIWEPSKKTGFLGQAWDGAMNALQACGLPPPPGRRGCDEFVSAALAWAFKCGLGIDMDEGHLEALSWEARAMAGESFAMLFAVARDAMERSEGSMDAARAFNAALEAKSIDAALWRRPSELSAKPRSRL